MLLRAKEIADLQRPSKRDWRSVTRWLLEKRPLVKSEQSFILRREDIVTLQSGRESAAFDDLVERIISKTDRVLQRFGLRIIQVGNDGVRMQFRLELTPEAVLIRNSRVANEDIGHHLELLRRRTHRQIGGNYYHSGDICASCLAGGGDNPDVQYRPAIISLSGIWHSDSLYPPLWRGHVWPDQGDAT